MWRRTIWLITTLAFGLLCAPFAPDAQQPGQVPRIGFVEPSSAAVNGHGGGVSWGNAGVHTAAHPQ